MIINLGIHPFKVETTLPCIIFIGGKKKQSNSISGGIRIRVRGGGQEEIKEKYKGKGGEREGQKAKGEYLNRI